MDSKDDDKVRLSDLHNAFHAHPFLVKGVNGHQDRVDTTAFGRFIGELGPTKRHTNLLKNFNRIKVGVFTRMVTFGSWGNVGGLIYGHVLVPPPQKVLCATSSGEKVAALVGEEGAGLCLSIFASSTWHRSKVVATNASRATPSSASASGASTTPAASSGASRAGGVAQWIRNIIVPQQSVTVSGSAIGSSFPPLASAKTSPRLIKCYSDMNIGQHEVDFDVRGNVSVGANTIDVSDSMPYWRLGMQTRERAVSDVIHFSTLYFMPVGSQRVCPCLGRRVQIFSYRFCQCVGPAPHATGVARVDPNDSQAGHQGCEQDRQGVLSQKGASCRRPHPQPSQSRDAHHDCRYLRPTMSGRGGTWE